MRIATTTIAVLLAIGGIGTADAATCTFSAAPTTLAFGNLTQLKPAVSSIATITVNCPAGQKYNVGLLAATLTNGKTAIPYKLYKDPAMTIMWGNTLYSNTVSGTGTGTPQVLTVYGQLPAMSSIPTSGNYAANVAVNLSY